tara:strand:- start:1 stop:837 length:837 start_codon:yes stop_codon:yes gene_type:complete
MQYCSIEEAWGIPKLDKKNKKKKQKKIYNSEIPKYIEDTSFLEGGHDNNCNIKKDSNFSTKNKDRFNFSRGNKNIYKKKQTRSPNVNISYNQAAEEYRKYQLENEHVKKQEKENNDFLIEGFESNDELNTIEDIENTFNDVDYNTDTENIDLYSPSTNYQSESENENKDDMDQEIKEIIDEAEENNVKNNTINKNNSKKKKFTNETINKSKNIEDIEDIDYRLNNLNRNVNSLIHKLNDNDFFDEESNDNIHDLILFILFGIFIIFVLDTIYKLGKGN